jgi:hypothetical protein
MEGRVLMIFNPTRNEGGKEAAEGKFEASRGWLLKFNKEASP